MQYDDLLTLRDAAKACGRNRKELQALVERGALPAVRRDGHWLVSRADLRLLYPAPPAPSAPSPRRADPPAAASAAPGLAADVETFVAAEAVVEPAPSERQLAKRHQTIELLLEMLRDRDAQIAALHEERARLTGQIGFLQGVLVERETRLHLIEAVPASPPLAMVAVPESPVAGTPSGSAATTAHSEPGAPGGSPAAGGVSGAPSAAKPATAPSTLAEVEAAAAAPRAVIMPVPPAVVPDFPAPAAAVAAGESEPSAPADANRVYLDDQPAASEPLPAANGTPGAAAATPDSGSASGEQNAFWAPQAKVDRLRSSVSGLLRKLRHRD